MIKSLSSSMQFKSPANGLSFLLPWASLVAQLVKNLPEMWETWVWSLGWEDPLEKGTATYSSILAWIILYSPWGSNELDMTDCHFTWIKLMVTPGYQGYRTVLSNILANICWWLLNASHYTKHFTRITSYNTCSKPRKVALGWRIYECILMFRWPW